MDDCYAGYFNGKTRITGDLLVDGVINGLLLSETVEQQLNSRQLAISEDSDNNMLDRLSTIRPVAYYKQQPAMQKAIVQMDDSVSDARQATTVEIQSYAKLHYGFSAEQIEDVYPDLVYTLDNGKKAVNYIELIPLLVQSIGELSERVEQLQQMNSTIKQKSLVSDIDVDDCVVLSVSQNTPNPFTDKTNIRVQIPESVRVARLYLYDMNGKQLLEFPVEQRGSSVLTLTSEGIEAGMYIYSLIADGTVVGTRRMIVTK